MGEKASERDEDEELRTHHHQSVTGGEAANPGEENGHQELSGNEIAPKSFQAALPGRPPDGSIRPTTMGVRRGLIPGIESFRGHTFHTSRWDYGYTGAKRRRQPDRTCGQARRRRRHRGNRPAGYPPRRGRRAGTVCLPAHPSTVDARDNRPTDPEWAASLKPGWHRERMENFLAVLAGEPVAESLVEDGWTATTNLQRKILSGAVDNTLPAEERELLDEMDDFRTMNRLRARVDDVVKDPATAEALKPWYRYMCKRPGFSDTYLQTFNRPNVTLVDTADTGRHHPHDREHRRRWGHRIRGGLRHLRHRIRSGDFRSNVRDPPRDRPQRPNPP
jgi:hypothetical protein